MRDTGRLLGAFLIFGAAFILCAGSVRAASTLTNVHTFQGLDGGWPSSIVVGDDGNLYGTTLGGGADFHQAGVNGGYGSGVVFMMTPAGAVTVLHTFDANSPSGGGGRSLIKGADGNFYGMTQKSVFKITPDGTYTSLHIFPPGDLDQMTSLVQGSDGNFYGTAAAGPDTTQVGPVGTNHGGFFQITPAGAYTLLHTFTTFAGPGPIFQASDGNFYVVTPGTADAQSGVSIFNTSGFVRTLRLFTSQEGQIARGGLIELADGSLIGTTAEQQLSGSGIVFSMDNAGTLTKLHQFLGPDGAKPSSALTLGADGNLYGVTAEGGSTFNVSNNVTGNGVAFLITPAGDFVKLGDLNLSYGQDTLWPLVQATSGDFYGVAQHGGPGASTHTVAYGPGAVFKVSPAVHIFPAGLQMISTPYDYTGDPVANLLTGPAAKLAVWNPSTRTYAVTPTPPAETFHQGGAAWVRFSQPSALIVRGSDITVNNNVAVPLKVGWNMIGDPSTIAVPIANLTVDSGGSSFTFAQAVSNGLVSSTLFSYDASSNGYVSHTSGDSLQPYTGYWLFAPSACTLEIPNIPPP